MFISKNTVVRYNTVHTVRGKRGRDEVGWRGGGGGQVQGERKRTEEKGEREEEGRKREERELCVMYKDIQCYIY